jgi:hypothetical protein
MQSNPPAGGSLPAALRSPLTLLGIAVTVGIAALTIALNLPVTNAPEITSQPGLSEGIRPAGERSEVSAAANQPQSASTEVREQAVNPAPESGSSLLNRVKMDAAVVNERPVSENQSVAEVQPGEAASEMRSSAVITAGAAVPAGGYSQPNGQTAGPSYGAPVGQTNLQINASAGGETSHATGNSGGDAAPSGPVAAAVPAERPAPVATQPGGTPSDAQGFRFPPNENYRAVNGNDAYNAAVNNSIKDGSPDSE